MSAVVLRLVEPEERPRPPRRQTNAESGRVREYMTEAEVDRLRAAARKRGRYGHRDDLMILLAFRHGLRVTEIVSLRWTSVNLDEAEVHIERLKKSRSGVHPLQGDEIRALRRLKREQPPGSGYVFVTERGGPFTRNGIDKMIRRAADAAGLGDIKPHAHMLRHSCGYAMAKDNENPLRIQAWLGHRDPSNTAIYVDLSAVQFKGMWKGRG